MKNETVEVEFEIDEETQEMLSKLKKEMPELTEEEIIVKSIDFAIRNKKMFYNFQKEDK